MELPDCETLRLDRRRSSAEKKEDFTSGRPGLAIELSRHIHAYENGGRARIRRGVRERFLLGANRDGTAAVIPFWHRGRVQGLIHRKLEGKPKYLYPKREEFPGAQAALHSRCYACRDFFVEGISMPWPLRRSERARGHRRTNISHEQAGSSRRLPEPFYVLADDDKEGAEAARDGCRTSIPERPVPRGVRRGSQGRGRPLPGTGRGC